MLPQLNAAQHFLTALLKEEFDTKRILMPSNTTETPMLVVFDRSCLNGVQVQEVDDRLLGLDEVFTVSPFDPFGTSLSSRSTMISRSTTQPHSR